MDHSAWRYPPHLVRLCIPGPLFRGNGKLAQHCWVLAGDRGFALTIFALLQTQRAVARTRQQIVAVLANVRREVRRSDCEWLAELLNRLGAAAERGDWEQVHVHARQCSQFAERLSLADGFSTDEKANLGRRADDLRIFARRVRRRPTPLAFVLSAPEQEMLDSLETLLDRAAARTFYEPLEVEDANDQ
jgi:hypothetical protein